MDVVAMVVPLDEIAHTVQVALTPVFLLSGIASLLNVLTSRHGRVAVQTDHIVALLGSDAVTDSATAIVRLHRLCRRLWTLNAARGCGAIAGVATCAATFALFVGALNNTAVATALFVFFGLSVLGTTMALLGYLAETFLSFPRKRSGIGSIESVSGADEDR